MKLWIGITDRVWFDFLAQRRPDELNFWQPGGGSTFKVLNPGEPFLFKLHSPNNFIVGGGFFVRHTQVPLSLAWEAFGEKNGAADYASFRQIVLKYRGQPGAGSDPVIGCIILAQPFFFAREQWIPVPPDWKPNIVQGKSYDADLPLGTDLWRQVQDRIMAVGPQASREAVSEERDRYGAGIMIQPRLGQGAFRLLVTDAYNRRCAITGERTLPVLESAHIKPYSAQGPHAINNGILLRSDLHRLFDLGYVTVTPDHHIEVSRRIREEFDNGREYYAHHGKPLLVMPSNIEDRPSISFLDWHNQNVFKV